jgi:hypothetical protein
MFEYNNNIIIEYKINNNNIKIYMKTLSLILLFFSFLFKSLR